MRLTCTGAIVVLLVLLATPPAGAREAAVEEAKARLAKNATDPFEQDKRERAIRDLGKIGGREAATLLLEVFDDPFEHLRDHAVSAWITMLKGERADETREWLASKALKHKNAAVRGGAATALGLDPAHGAIEAVTARLAKERDPSVLVALTRAWMQMPGRDVTPVWKLLRNKSGAVALAAADALVRTGTAARVPPAECQWALGARPPGTRAGGVRLLQAGDGLTLEQVESVLADRDELPRMVLAESLGDRPDDAVLERLLDDASWRVRAGALKTVRRLWRREHVPLLIERLDREDGRLKLDVVGLLQDLTGKDLAWDAELWRAWWAAQGEGFEMPERPLGDARPEERDRSPAGAESKTAAFFELPVVSSRIAFLLDCSGSMRTPALGEKVGGITKMEVAREELAKTLADLEDSARFDVFLYRYPSEFPPRPEMTRAFGKLQACTPRRARAATTWLAKQPAKGWGAFYDALRLLLDDPDIDTIYFLSDGRPSRGRYDRDFRLLAEIVPDNRFRHVVVHTVLVGTAGADRRFLEDLAAATGGRFVDAVPQMKETARGAGGSR